MIKKYVLPTQPTEEQLNALSGLRIDITKGLVWGRSGKLLRANNDGRYSVTVYYGKTGIKAFKRSHVVWWKAKGVWPKLQLDHIDDNKSYDGINNLQELTHIDNVAKSKGKSKPRKPKISDERAAAIVRKMQESL